jgi:hypothetical protein
MIEQIDPTTNDGHYHESDENVPISIIKIRSKREPRYIKDSTRGWGALPKPELDHIIPTNSPSPPAAESDNTSSERPKKKVEFSSIQIRTYSQTLGDNPSVTYGPPIQLDWYYEEHDTICIDSYEATRGKRRNTRQMCLNYYQRKNLLSWQYGVSEEELKKAKRDANKIKLKRSITRALLPIMPVESVLESASRKAKRLVSKNRN